MRTTHDCGGGERVCKQNLLVMVRHGERFVVAFACFPVWHLERELGGKARKISMSKLAAAPIY